MSPSKNFATIGLCEVDSTAKIQDGAIIGKPFRPFLDGSREAELATRVKQHAYIGYNAIVGNGSTIAERSIVDDYSVIESRVLIGSRALVIYRAQICNDAHIGNDCVIGGFVGERTKIEAGCRVFGKVIHRQNEPQKGWDDEDVEETAPRILHGAFIGFDAIVAGGITVGQRAYICAGAIVTRDVPDLHIAAGTNRIAHFSEWKGPLKDSGFFVLPVA